MRVLNVVSVFSARDGGGNAERTALLSRALADCGVACTVMTLDIGNLDARAAQIPDVRLERVPCLLRRFQVPWLRWGQIKNLVANNDVIHLMGHWSVLGALVYLAARRAGVPYVVSPAGALPLFGRSLWLKRAFNLLIGKRLIRQASGWIAITRAEAADFHAYGIGIEQVAVFPNGVIERDYAADADTHFFHQTGIPMGPFILFMGRLNPIKGPDLLLPAFARVAEDHPDLRLVFAGPDEGLQTQLEQWSSDLGLRDRVHFVGFVGGALKVAAYRSASLLVVPSRMEAMSIVAVEGGICGTPVLMTNQCGLDELGEVDPNLLVPATETGLESGLRFALADARRLHDLGLKWQSMVRKRFLWSDLGVRFRDYLNKIAAKGNS